MVLLEEQEKCTLPMGGKGSPQDINIPRAEYCDFKDLLNITRSKQTDVHKPKKLNFVHFISFEMQIGIQKKKKVSHFIAACL